MTHTSGDSHRSSSLIHVSLASPCRHSLRQFSLSINQLSACNFKLLMLDVMIFDADCTLAHAQSHLRRVPQVLPAKPLSSCSMRRTCRTGETSLTLTTALNGKSSPQKKQAIVQMQNHDSVCITLTRKCSLLSHDQLLHLRRLSTTGEIIVNCYCVCRLEDATGGKCPAVRDNGLHPAKWVGGLFDISRHLQDRHPETPLGIIGFPTQPLGPAAANRALP